jgi:hypothetical protein
LLKHIHGGEHKLHLIKTLNEFMTNNKEKHKFLVFFPEMGIEQIISLLEETRIKPNSIDQSNCKTASITEVEPSLSTVNTILHNLLSDEPTKFTMCLQTGFMLDNIANTKIMLFDTYGQPTESWKEIIKRIFKKPEQKSKIVVKLFNYFLRTEAKEIKMKIYNEVKSLHGRKSSKFDKKPKYKNLESNFEQLIDILEKMLTPFFNKAHCDNIQNIPKSTSQKVYKVFIEALNEMTEYPKDFSICTSNGIIVFKGRKDGKLAWITGFEAVDGFLNRK